MESTSSQNYIVVDTMPADPVLRDPMTGKIQLCRTPAGQGWVLVDDGKTAVWELREPLPMQQQ